MNEPFNFYNPITGEIGRAQTLLDPAVRGLMLPPVPPAPLPGGYGAPILGHPSPQVANGLLPPTPGGW
jgi:hypothetical protein